MTVSFFVPGEPVAKGRPRAFKMKNGNIGNYTPDKTVAYEERVKYFAWQVRPPEPFDCPLSVTMQFVMLKPKSAKKRQYPSVKPDLDNLAKSIMDPMNGLIYVDDSRVCLVSMAKGYTDDAAKVGVTVGVSELQ